MPIKRSNRGSVLTSCSTSQSSSASDSVFVNPFKNPSFGTRTGVDVKAGKNIRRDENGYELFDDYWSDASELDESCDKWLKERQNKRKTKPTTKQAKAAQPVPVTAEKPKDFRVDSPPRSISPFSTGGGGDTPRPVARVAVGGSITKGDKSAELSNSALKSFEINKRLTYSKASEDGSVETSNATQDSGRGTVSEEVVTCDTQPEEDEGGEQKDEQQAKEDLDATLTEESQNTNEIKSGQEYEEQRTHHETDSSKPVMGDSVKISQESGDPLASPVGIAREGEVSGSITKGDKSGEALNSAMKTFHTKKRLTYSKVLEEAASDRTSIAQTADKSEEVVDAGNEAGQETSSKDEHLATEAADEEDQNATFVITSQDVPEEPEKAHEEVEANETITERSGSCEHVTDAAESNQEGTEDQHEQAASSDDISQSKFISLSPPKKAAEDVGSQDDVNDYEIISSDDVVHKKSTTKNERRNSVQKNTPSPNHVTEAVVSNSTEVPPVGEETSESSNVAKGKSKGKKLTTLSARKRNLQDAKLSKAKTTENVVDEVVPTKKSRRSTSERRSVNKSSLGVQGRNRTTAFSELLEDVQPTQITEITDKTVSRKQGSKRKESLNSPSNNSSVFESQETTPHATSRRGEKTSKTPVVASIDEETPRTTKGSRKGKRNATSAKNQSPMEEDDDPDEANQDGDYDDAFTDCFSHAADASPDVPATKGRRKSKVKTQKSVQFAESQSESKSEDEEDKKSFRKTPAANRNSKRKIGKTKLDATEASPNKAASDSPGPSDRKKAVQFTEAQSSESEGEQHDRKAYRKTPAANRNVRRRSSESNSPMMDVGMSPGPSLMNSPDVSSPPQTTPSSARHTESPGSAPRSILKKKPGRKPRPSMPGDLLLRDVTVVPSPVKKSRVSFGGALEQTTTSPQHFFEVTTTQSPVPTEKPTQKPKIIYPSEAPDGLRRSRRARVQTLQWYKNERVQYDRRKSGLFIADVLSPTVTEDDVARQRKKPAAKKKKKARGKKAVPATPRNLSIHADAADEEINDDPEIKVINPDLNEEVYLTCLATKDTFNFRGPQGRPAEASDPLTLCKGIQQPAFSIGQLVLKPLAVKETQIVRNDSMAFTVLRGKLAVTIHKSTSILETEDVFFVPKGNTYSLKNMRNEICKLCFFQLKG